MIDLTTMTARKIAGLVRRRELTARAVAEVALDRIAQLDVPAIAESNSKFPPQPHDLKAQPRVEQGKNGEICGGN